MERRNFLKKLCSATGVAIVAPVVIAGALDPGPYPGLTMEKLTEVVHSINIAHYKMQVCIEKEFVLYTGRQGYDEFTKALREHHEKQTELS